MMAEETPYAGVGVAHVLEIDRTIGITEREILIFAIEKTFLAGEGDDIVGVDAFHLRVVDIFQVFAADCIGTDSDRNGKGIVG